MEYLITTVKGDDRKIISRHETLEEAKGAGRELWKEVPKGVLVSCISGTVNDEGKIIGKYALYEAWF